MTISAGNNISQAHNLTETTLTKVLDIIKTRPLNNTKKESAPFYLPSGIFTKNSIDGIVPESYTGLVCIDIDNVPDGTLELLRESIYRFGHEYDQSINPFKAIIKSISNNLYILIQTTNKDHTLHKFYYDCAYNLVVTMLEYLELQHLNLKVDYLPNINRARFLSYDRNLIQINFSYYDPSSQDIAFALSKISRPPQQNVELIAQQNVESQAQSQNVGQNNTEQSLLLADAWATAKHGKFIHNQKGNRDNWLHHIASGANNLGIPKQDLVTYLLEEYYTNQETGEIYDTYTTNVSGVNRPIDSAYSRTDQFGTLILHSDKPLKVRLQSLINKKLIYLSKNEEKSVYLLDEINLLNDLMGEI